MVSIEMLELYVSIAMFERYKQILEESILRKQKNIR